MSYNMSLESSISPEDTTLRLFNIHTFGHFMSKTAFLKSKFEVDPVRVHRHNVPHFKGLIDAKVDLEAQGHGSTFTLCHAQLKTAILLLEMAKGMNIKEPECSLRL